MWEVYAYWNTIELQGMFNAAAALMNSADYRGLLRMFALIGIFSLVIVVLAGRGKQEDFGKWILMVAIFNGLLLVPKTTVVVVDRTSSNPPAVISNVPIGMAVFTSSISKVGDYLTRAYETVFALPGDLQFHSNGLMFGHTVQEQLRNLKPRNMEFMNDFVNFYRECILPELLPTNPSRAMTVTGLSEAADTWAYINGKVNPGLLVTLSSGGTMNCPAAYTNLNNRITSTETPALTQTLAKTLLPNDPNQLVKVNSAITASDSFIFNVSRGAPAAIRQGMIGNMLVNAECAVQAQSNNVALATQCLSIAEGHRTTNSSYAVMAKIAESSMPKLRNAIELIQYAVFPIMLLMVISAGHAGMSVLRVYAQSLLWVQLWPPLYAVVNYIMTNKSQAWSAITDNNAGALIYHQWVSGATIEDKAVAGMLVIAIPPIAAALVKGGEIGLQAVAGLVSPPKGAEKTAQEIATGNMRAGQMNMAPAGEFGTPLMSQRQADGSTLNTNASGAQRLDKGTSLDSMGYSVSSQGRESQGASIASERAQTAAMSNMVSASHSTQAALKQTADFLKYNQSSQGGGQEWGSGVNTNISQAYQTAQNATKQFAVENGLSQDQAAQVLAAASAATSGGFDFFGNSAKIGAELKAQGVSSATANQAIKNAQGFAKTSGYNDSINAIRSATNTETFRQMAESGVRGAAGMAAALDETKAHTEQAQANYQKSLAFKELGTKASEHGVTVNQDLTTRVNDRLATERATIDGHTYNGFTRQEVNALMASNNQDMRRLVDRIAGEETAAIMQEKYGDLKTPADVRQFFEDGKQQIPSAGAVRSQGQAWLGAVAGNADAAGANPNNTVTSELPGRVAADQSAHTQMVRDGKSDVEEKGKPVEELAVNRTKPGEQPLLGMAMTNGEFQVLPTAISTPLAKLGMDTGMVYSGASVPHALDQNNPNDPVYNAVSGAVSHGVNQISEIDNRTGGFDQVFSGAGASLFGSRTNTANVQQNHAGEADLGRDTPPPRK